MELEAAQEYVRKAYELKDRVSERERLYIDSQYCSHVPGDREKALQAYGLRAQIYPRDANAHNNLANVYRSLGRYEQALPEALVAMRMDPENEDNYITLSVIHLSLNRLKEAEEVLTQAVDNKLDSEGLVFQRYQVAFVNLSGIMTPR